MSKCQNPHCNNDAGHYPFCSPCYRLQQRVRHAKKCDEPNCDQPVLGTGTKCFNHCHLVLPYCRNPTRIPNWDHPHKCCSLIRIRDTRKGNEDTYCDGPRKTPTFQCEWMKNEVI
jgi:hypothetical protein